MGITLDIHCQTCGWKDGFRLGLGQSVSRLEDALELVPEEQRIRIRELIAENGCGHAEDFELCLARCPACGRLFERMHVSVCFADGRQWRCEHRCGRCGCALDMTLSPGDIPSLPCPSCGAAALAAHDAGFWS